MQEQNPDIEIMFPDTLNVAATKDVEDKYLTQVVTSSPKQVIHLFGTYDEAQTFINALQHSLDNPEYVWDSIEENSFKRDL
jgi:cob(I)alamin adenosyltransferase